MTNNFDVKMDEYLPLRDVVFKTLRQAILKGELEPGERLMEIKAPGALPLWLADALSGQGVFPISFSKYGSAYCQKMGGSAPGDDRHLKEKGASICA